ncbi:patatin-like phospholipase family protein [Thalassotalea mangrovi]|uniref:Patatin-like phospholipase family protein n=1 Tax=Thalassotalea mangrovi TaxID=2572245 RepID=A0A4U1B5I1_9GAMM|nr:patatin-like phospholipase family protein [Thalassotalea mangrovi]TKB45071.1 patatin-like phospholipase family protein [Thalassotalea mangrovi]
MAEKKSYKGCKTALMLTGGGARAAYQVGVLKAIARFMPRNHGIPFPIICGTSAGAINATTIACYASCFHLGVRKLEWIWNNLHTGQIYHSTAGEVFGHIIAGFFSNFQSPHATLKSYSLLNNEPLRELLNQVVDFKRIDVNIINNYLSSIAITASSYSCGDSISFYQADKSIEPWQRAKRRGEQCQLTTEHLMASSSIPFIFSPVRINQKFYGDGSVNQLSPLSPPIHLGAERIFIVGVEQPEQEVPLNHYPINLAKFPAPTFATVAGHLMDTVFAETMNSDLERLQRINHTVQLIDESKRDSQTSLRNIDTLLINPSENFNRIAQQHYGELNWPLRLLLRFMGATKDAESSLTSYILFEQNYCKRLIQVGFEDAMEKEQEIREFLAI